MDIPKFLSFILVLFCLHLSNCAPVFNGLLENANVSTRYEADFAREVFLTSANLSTNVSENDLKNNLTNGDLSLVLHGKSTFKKIVGKIKSWKNKITGGGGSNKIKNNKDGSKGGGGISIHRPIRPINSNGDYTLDHIMIAGLGFMIVLGIIIGCLKKDEDENAKEEKENKEDGKETEEGFNKHEGKYKENEVENEIQNEKKIKNENLNIMENTAL